MVGTKAARKGAWKVVKLVVPMVGWKAERKEVKTVD